MGKRKKADSPPETPAADLPWEGWALTALWAGAFVALALVADQKVLRYKLLAVEGFAGAGLAAAFLGWAARSPALWRKTPLDLPVALYALGGLAFFALSPERGAAHGELNRVLLSATAFFAASQTAARLARPRAAAGAWALSGAALGVYALLQTRGGLGPVMVPQLEPHRHLRQHLSGRVPSPRPAPRRAGRRRRAAPGPVSAAAALVWTTRRAAFAAAVTGLGR